MLGHRLYEPHDLFFVNLILILLLSFVQAIKLRWHNHTSTGLLSDDRGQIYTLTLYHTRTHASTHYTKKIDSVKYMGYWEKLKELGLCYLERRPGAVCSAIHIENNGGSSSKFQSRSLQQSLTGWHCTVPKILYPSRMQTQYCNSLGFKEPQLLNVLPLNIRDLRSVDIEFLKFLYYDFPSSKSKDTDWVV